MYCRRGRRVSSPWRASECLAKRAAPLLLRALGSPSQHRAWTLNVLSYSRLQRNQSARISEDLAEPILSEMKQA